MTENNKAPWKTFNYISPDYNRPSQDVLKLLNGPERQYIELSSAGKSIEVIAKVMRVDTNEVLKMRQALVNKLMNSNTLN